MDLLIRVGEPGSLPLKRQVFEQLRQAILDGRLRPGERLPSSRLFAQRLGISRTTVCLAYEQLLAEGYVEGRHGSGTYVAAHAVAEGGKGGSQRQKGRAATRSPLGRLSAWGKRLPARRVASRSPAAYDFRPGQSAWPAFSWSAWRRLFARRLRQPTPETLAYGDPAGYAPLRAAIAAHLRHARGVCCEAEQVVIVSGTQQTLDLLARLLIDPGDQVALEDPGYLGARQVFNAYGAQVRPVPVDAAGLMVAHLPSPGESAQCKLVYVTPSHQFPTGATLSLARRLALLDWATSSGALVLEDDYDSEFRYGSRPLESLQGLDATGSVVYMSSFSEALFPSLRIGYVVLPPFLLDRFLAARELADRQTPTVEQQVLADFLETGLFSRHLRRLRRLYEGRRAALLDALEHHLGGLATVTGASAGTHVMVWLPPLVPEEALIAEASRRGVGLETARPYFAMPPPGTALLLSYAALDEDQIREGVARLAEAIAQIRRSARHEAVAAASPCDGP